MQPIRNRVEESGLVQLELGSIDRVSCVEFEINHLLRGGLIVVEKNLELTLRRKIQRDLKAMVLPLSYVKTRLFLIVLDVDNGKIQQRRIYHYWK